MDFLIHRGGRHELYEAKWSEHPGEEDIANLAYVTKLLDEKNVSSQKIVCRTRNPYPIARGVSASSIHEM